MLRDKVMEMSRQVCVMTSERHATEMNVTIHHR